MNPAAAVSEPAGAALTDEEVVRRVLAGEPELFELLVRRHNQTLYRAVRSILRDEAETEDAMQQAYLLAFSRLSQFEGNAKLSTWMVRIAIHEALGRLRRERRFVALESEISPLPSPEDDVTRRELAELLETAVDALPEIHRTVFVLRDVEGLSTREVAEILGTTEEAVRTRLHRARTLLDQRLHHAARTRTDEAFLFHAPRCDRVVAAVMSRIASGG